MRKAAAVTTAFAVAASVMICGCANQTVQGPAQAAVEKKIVTNGEKPAETVERVPDQVAEVKAPEAKETAGTAAEKETAKTAETAKNMETKAQAAPEGDLISNDYTPYAGKYTRTDDGSTFTLTKDGKVDIGITRLTQMDGKADGIYKGIIKITVKDANGGDMGLEFLTETNELVVTDSKWSLLPNGETFKFDKKE